MKTKKIYLFIFLLLSAFLFRLFLSPLVFHTDLLCQAEWGERLYTQKPASFFYRSPVWTFCWPNHPPLTSLHYSFSYTLYRHFSLRLHQSLLLVPKFHLWLPASYQNFVLSFDHLVSPEQPFSLGFLLTLKLLPIIGDLLIALLIYLLSRSLLFPSLYLFSPFSFYLSALWGQTDQIAAFLTLFSFLLLPKNTFFSTLSFYFSLSLKPTSVFLLPLYLFLLFRHRPKFFSLLISFFACLLLTFIIFHPFAVPQNIFDFTLHTLLPRLTDRPDRLTTNSYNFWHIFTLDQGLTPTLLEKIISYLFYFIINLFAFKSIKKLDTRHLLFSLFVVSFGSWLFLTNMLDRYSFVGILSSLLLVIYFPRTLKYWLPLSLIYWLNLLRGWYFPFPIFKILLTSGHYIAGLPLSLLNCLFYFLLIREVKKSL